MVITVDVDGLEMMVAVVVAVYVAVVSVAVGGWFAAVEVTVGVVVMSQPYSTTAAVVEYKGNSNPGRKMIN